MSGRLRNFCRHTCLFVFFFFFNHFWIFFLISHLFNLFLIFYDFVFKPSSHFTECFPCVSFDLYNKLSDRPAKIWSINTLIIVYFLTHILT